MLLEGYHSRPSFLWGTGNYSVISSHNVVSLEDRQFVVGNVETVKTLPPFYLPELDLLQWLREAILSSAPRACPGPHCHSEEPLISPCQSYSSSKISQCAINLHRGGSQSCLTSGNPQGLPFLGKTKKSQSKKENQSYYVLSNQQ